MADQWRETPMFTPVREGMKSVWQWDKQRWLMRFKGTRDDCLRAIRQLREQNLSVDAANFKIEDWQ